MSFVSKFLALFLWQVNQKMMLTLTASIMYWSLQQKAGDSESSPSNNEKLTPEPPEEEESEARISTSGISSTNASGVDNEAT